MSDPIVAKWTQALGGPSVVRPGNRVLPLIEGPATFQAMYDAMITATRRGHYIYLLGWWLDDTISLTGQPRGLNPSLVHSVQNVFRDAVRLGVQVRVMLYDQVGKAKNSAEIKRINALGGDGAGILDDRTIPIRTDPDIDAFLHPLAHSVIVAGEQAFFPVGSHHQKVLLVRGDRGLIAFCGGLDINEDRIYDTPADKQAGAPMHDIHCRIKGPAAHDLVEVFVRRWQAHPGHVKIDRVKGELVGLPDRDPRGRSKKGQQQVRIAQNFNFVSNPAAAKNGWCVGEQSIRPTMLAAIKAARRFIYIEDQYLANPEAANALKLALPNLQYIVMVVPHPSMEKLFASRRADFIRTVMGGPEGTKKVMAFYRYTPHGAHPFGPYTYIHAKTWVIDDELAVIGSANCNNRGWSFDSEVIAAIFDVKPGAAGLSFAQKLRMQLWSMHLGVSPLSVVHARTRKALDKWKQLPPNARVAAYPLDYHLESQLANLDPGDIDPSAVDVQLYPRCGVGERPTILRFR